MQETQKFDFDSPLDRRESNSLKWGSRAVKAEGLTPLSVADMDFPVDTQLGDDLFGICSCMKCIRALL